MAIDMTQDEFEKHKNSGWTTWSTPNGEHRLEKKVGVCRCFINTCCYIPSAPTVGAIATILVAPVACIHSMCGCIEESPFTRIANQICNINQAVRDYFNPCECTETKLVRVISSPTDRLVSKEPFA